MEITEVTREELLKIEPALTEYELRNILEDYADKFHHISDSMQAHWMKQEVKRVIEGRSNLL